MQPQLQSIELEAVALHDDELAVDDTAFGQVGLHGLDNFGEISGQWTLVARPQLDFFVISEDDAAKPVPFGLVKVTLRRTVGFGNVADQLGEHGGDGRHHRKFHAVILAGGADVVDRLVWHPDRATITRRTNALVAEMDLDRRLDAAGGPVLPYRLHLSEAARGSAAAVPGTDQARGLPPDQA